MGNGPLVSVGIPTYNRPEGLRRTLTQISNQSYRNIEIIVSDNCSDNPEVQKILNEFSSIDPRIRPYKQEVNIGMPGNFIFVLKEAKGPYFMWAADDDEWLPGFIEECVNHIGDAGCVMQSNFKTIYRSTHKEEYTSIPELSTNNSHFQNCVTFLQNLQPCLVYGMFKKQALDFLVTGETFTGLDLHILIRVILYDGFNTFPKQLFTYGVDTGDYEIKSLDSKTSKIVYRNEIWNSVKCIFRCKNINFRQKSILAKCHIVGRGLAFVSYEKARQPVKAMLIYRFLQCFIFSNNLICKLTGTRNYSIKPKQNLTPTNQ